MKITWLGHAGFRLELGEEVLLIDPWLTGNPVFPAAARAEAIAGATALLITHAHSDHIADAVPLAKELDIPLIGIFDLTKYLEAEHGIDTIGVNKGGTLKLKGVEITAVNASHSSSLPGPAGPIAVGAELGYMIAAEGRTIYLSGDTDIMADMEWMGELHAPEIGILCAGGHFTMDMKRAAWAAKRYFNFKTIIPSHYNTFPALAQDPQVMRDALPGVEVLALEVMGSAAL